MGLAISCCVAMRVHTTTCLFCPLFAASLVVLKVEGMGLCKTDEVGEICMRASSVGSSFWGLPGLTNATFRAKPENDDESVAWPDQEFVRTGLLGFLGPVSQCSRLFR